MEAPRDLVSLPFPARDVPAATMVRGSVIASSLRSLRRHQLEEAYFRALPSDLHPLIRGLTAASWAPVSTALAHYAACEKLDLPRTTIEAIGADTGAFLNASVLAVLLRASREMGLSPWNAFSNIERLRERLWVGSALAVMQVGPKEARIDWYGQPCGQFTYYKTAFGAFMLGIVRPMARALYIRPLEKPTPLATISYRASWV